jgi:hypothetical protein
MALDDGVYIIQPMTGYHIGLALDVPSVGLPPPAGWGDGVVIQQWILHQGINQQWQITNDRTGTDHYTIVSAYSKKALDVPWGLPRSSQPGLQIQQFEPHGGPNQLWHFETFPAVSGAATRPEHHIISNKASGLVLDIPYGWIQIGVNLQQYTRRGGWNQRWVLWKQ